MTKTSNICIFPGTFNPIHVAHLSVANFALNSYGFDKIIFIPSATPPHKEVSTNLSEHRLKMVELAVSTNSKFEVSDIEYHLNGKSYTYNTVCALKNKYNIKGKINMLIGTDAFEKIESWYRVDELKELVHFIVFPRGVELTEKKGFDYEMAPMPFMDISSTNIRTECKNDTIESVKDYIEKNGLYKN